MLEQAVAEKPKAEGPLLMLARLAEKKNDKAGARKAYESVLPLMSAGVEKERVTRALMILCIELDDFDGAAKYHKQLVTASNNSLFVKKELGNELYHRGHYQKAEAEFRKMVTASAGDNRALAPALRDLGKALAKQKKMKEALEVLERARNIAGQQAGIRAEILQLLTDVFRDQGKLVELIAILEKEDGRDFNRVATIGALYEETGQVDKALDSYREALKLSANDIDVRVKLVHLLQTAGRLDEAIKEYEALIKTAPHNADFVFELAETFIQRGERERALKLVGDLERRSANEGDTLAAVADFYERIEEQDRAVKVLERLAKLPQGDPQYLIDLGDRYFQQGDRKKAEATWARIRTMIPNRASAEATLGEVYLDHDMPNESLEAFREAVKLAPNQTRYKKQLAIALERTASSVRATNYRYREALKIWEELLQDAGDDELLARECRTHIVSLWSILRQLPEKVAPLMARLDADPPDLEAGRLLAEVQRRLSKLKDAEKTLRKVVGADPGDESSLLALERVLVMQRNLSGAIDVLEKLAARNPKRAREYYQRMAQYAAELYLDDDAIKYAAQAVELSPDDAHGHHRLGQMYRRRQNNERAMIEFRKAISKNDRLFPAYFDLAELLLSSGKVDDADKLYRHVVRAARDEEFVMRAARLSMQINLGKGTLESLERELLPVALGNPQKSVYRRLLVELYGAMTFPLVHAARLGDGKTAAKAREELSKIGARAVKPLLDALGDKKDQQQRIAIEVLAYVQNKGAGPALFNFATSAADRELRVRAMVACGALEDPELLPRYRQLLVPGDAADALAAPGDAVAVAAAWGVARMRSPQAVALLAELVGSGSPDIRALAALGLGLSKNPKYAETLAELARSPEAGPAARAAAAHALGELGATSQRPLLLALTDSPELEVQMAATLALAHSGESAGIPEDVGAILARAILGEQSELRRTAMAAATALSEGRYARAGDEALPVPDGVIVVTDVLRGLAPHGFSRDEQAKALAALRPQLTRSAQAAVATSPERAQVVAELTMTSLAPLIDGAGALSPAAARDLAATSDAVAEASVKGFVALTRHPSVAVRKRAVEFLARRAEQDARNAVTAALDPRDPEVCKAALTALDGRQADATTVTAIVKLLAASDNWALRAHAARALGRIDAPAEARAEVSQSLERAALKDDFALVREAAIAAVAERGGPAAKALLDKVAQSDAEPRLRQIAAELAKK